MAFNISRLGQENQSGDERDLFLKQYAGEVLTAFRQKTAFAERHRTKTLESGKSASFPASGRIGVRKHTPGTQITGQKMNHAERVITIDGKLIADASIADIDEAMNHYDVREEYTTQSGEALAQHYDRNVSRVGVLAARDTATVDDLPGGTTINEANSKTDSDVFGSALFTAQEKLDEKDVPDSDRYAFVPIKMFYLLAQNKTYINRDYGGSGSIAEGVIYTVGGLPIVKTNNLAKANDLSNSDLEPKYQGDFSVTSGLVMHKGAAGTVKLMDLSVESDWLIDYQVWLTISKYMVGHGILRPESAVEIRTGDPAAS